jgi:hypothetical protein
MAKSSQHFTAKNIFAVAEFSRAQANLSEFTRVFA